MTTRPAFSALARAASSLALVLAFGLAASIATLTSAEELSPKEIRKLDRAAGKALKAGRTGEAAELYQQLLDATDAGEERRQEALWVVAMKRLASDPGDEAGRACLLELEEAFPRHEHQLELGALQAAFGGLDEARAAIDDARARLEEQQEAFAAARRMAEEEQQKIAGESAEADERVGELESQLRRVRAALAETKEELEKKEEALQRLLKLRSERGSG